MATYITIETDKKIAYQIDGGEKNVMFANIEDDGEGYPEPTGTKQISIMQNGTITENVKDYASAEITVNVSSGINNYVQGTFTVPADKTKTVTVEHGLGKVPKFGILYPVDVQTSDSASGYFVICGMVLFDGVGQTNYNIVDGATIPYNKAVAVIMYTYPGRPDSHIQTGGVSLSNNQLMGYADSTNIIFGGITTSPNGGQLAAGTYGYIIG